MKLHSSKTAAENARALLPKMARKYFEAGRDAIARKRPPEELHRFRLETKRFRYTLELFRPFYGPKLERHLTALRELQNALGKVSDYQTIQRVLPGDRNLDLQIERGLKAKLKDLRKVWRDFDSEGELKRWKTYLAGRRSTPRTASPRTGTPRASKPRVKAPVRTVAKKGVTAAEPLKITAQAAG